MNKTVMVNVLLTVECGLVPLDIVLSEMDYDFGSTTGKSTMYTEIVDFDIQSKGPISMVNALVKVGVNSKEIIDAIEEIQEAEYDFKSTTPNAVITSTEIVDITEKPAATSPYVVICSDCGPQALTKEQYNKQMNMPDARWKCPICRQEADWDDDNYDDWCQNNHA